MRGVSFAFAVGENRLRWGALPQFVQRKRPQGAYRAPKNPLTGACYSAAKPSHRDHQGYSVDDGTDKERIIDGRRPGTAPARRNLESKLFPQLDKHGTPIVPIIWRQPFNDFEALARERVEALWLRAREG
jgi:hypothetical protein